MHRLVSVVRWVLEEGCWAGSLVRHLRNTSLVCQSSSVCCCAAPLRTSWYGMLSSTGVLLCAATQCVCAYIYLQAACRKLCQSLADRHGAGCVRTYVLLCADVGIGWRLFKAFSPLSASRSLRCELITASRHVVLTAYRQHSSILPFTTLMTYVISTSSKLQLYVCGDPAH
jgi:hypothetical protein